MCTNRSFLREKEGEEIDEKTYFTLFETKICLRPRYQETELEFIANRTSSQECVT